MKLLNKDDLMNIYSTTDIQDNKEAKETSKLINAVGSGLEEE